MRFDGEGATGFEDGGEQRFAGFLVHLFRMKQAGHFEFSLSPLTAGLDSGPFLGAQGWLGIARRTKMSRGTVGDLHDARIGEAAARRRWWRGR